MRPRCDAVGGEPEAVVRAAEVDVILIIGIDHQRRNATRGSAAIQGKVNDRRGSRLRTNREPRRSGTERGSNEARLLGNSKETQAAFTLVHLDLLLQRALACSLRNKAKGKSARLEEPILPAAEEFRAFLSSLQTSIISRQGTESPLLFGLLFLRLSGVGVGLRGRGEGREREK